MISRKFGFCAVDEGCAKAYCVDFISGGTTIIPTIRKVKLIDKICRNFIEILKRVKYKSILKVIIIDR